MGEVPHYILFCSLSNSNRDLLDEHGVRLIVISKIELLPQSVQMAIRKAVFNVHSFISDIRMMLVPVFRTTSFAFY
jgi:hypothetical protein